MKTQTILTVLGVAGLSLQALAQTNPADKLDAWKKTREEYIQAEKELLKQSLSGSSLDDKLSELTEKKQQLSKSLVYFNSKYNSALASAGVASSETGKASADREVAAWAAQVKSAESEIQALENQIRDLGQQLQDSMLQGDSSSLLLPGQAVQLYVLEDETFNGLYQIRRGGYVILPRIGRVTIAGKDLLEAEKTIQNSLQATQLRQATVMLEKSREFYSTESSNLIYLAGAFKTTGPLLIPDGVQPTLVTTLLRAGGLTDTADLTRVKLLRLEGGNGLVEEVNVAAIMDGSSLTSDLNLNAGDIIVVPHFAPVVYVTGNVTTPGAIELDTEEEVTAYSAILKAGGFARFASLKRVYILRDRGNGEKTRIPLNIKDLRKGKIKDVLLQGQDIVHVPQSWFSW